MFARVSDLASDDPGSGWLYTNRVPKSSGILVAPQGAGKTMFALDGIVKPITLGGECLGAPLVGEPGAVYFVGADPGHRGEIIERTKAWPAPAKERLLLEQGSGFNLAEDRELLPRLKAENCRLMIIDNLTAFVGKHDIDTPAGFYGAMEPFRELMEEIPVLLLAHTGKNSRGGPAHSHAITAWARMLIEIRKSPWHADGYRQAQELYFRGNNAPPLKFGLQMKDDGTFDWWSREGGAAEAPASGPSPSPPPRRAARKSGVLKSTPGEKAAAIAALGPCASLSEAGRRLFAANLSVSESGGRAAAQRLQDLGLFAPARPET